MRPAKRWLREAIASSMGVHAINKLIWTPDIPIVYVDNPKCGSSTIKYSLKQAQATKYSHAGLGFWRSAEPHKADDCFKTRGLRVETGRNRFIISCVRNPFTRALSAYLDRITPHNLKHFPELRARYIDSFERYLSAVANYPTRRLNFHLRPQHLNLDFPNIRYDAVFYLEALPVLSGFFACVAPELSVRRYAPHARSAHAKLADHYTERAVGLVQEIYAKDFHVFGYSPHLEDVDKVLGACIVDDSIKNGAGVLREILLRHARREPCRALVATIRYHRLIDALNL